MMAQFKERGIEINGIIMTDASAALGMVHRQGLGRTRHIDVQYLWIQGEVMDEKLAVKKVRTEDNPADVLTKALKPEVMMGHTGGMGFRHESTRASAALAVNAVSKARGERNQATRHPGRNPVEGALARSYCVSEVGGPVTRPP